MKLNRNPFTIIVTPVIYESSLFISIVVASFGPQVRGLYNKRKEKKIIILPFFLLLLLSLVCRTVKKYTAEKYSFIFYGSFVIGGRGFFFFFFLYKVGGVLSKNEGENSKKKRCSCSNFFFFLFRFIFNIRIIFETNIEKCSSTRFFFTFKK